MCVRACVCVCVLGTEGHGGPGQRRPPSPTPCKRACLYPPWAPARAPGGYTHFHFQLHLHLAACCAIPGVWHSEGMTHTVTDHFSLFSYAIPSVWHTWHQKFISFFVIMIIINIILFHPTTKPPHPPMLFLTSSLAEIHQCGLNLNLGHVAYPD